VAPFVQYSREPACEHGLSRTRRPAKEYVRAAFREHIRLLRNAVRMEVCALEESRKRR